MIPFLNPYIELWPLNILQIDGYRTLSRLIVVDIAHSMRSQIGLAILVLGNLEFSTNRRLAAYSKLSVASSLPLIQAYSILHK